VAKADDIPPLRIGEVDIPAGASTRLELPFARLYTRKSMTLPVQVIRGRRAGPTLFVSAAIHGDEINGVEIIRRLLRLSQIQKLRGTLIAVPIVNVHGFIHHTRYLPDRRDLNRSFPGSETGSLTARLANLFLEEIVSKCSHGIDLHTGAIHRENLPQIRANFDHPETLAMARAFAVPVLLDSDLRDGSLRQVADERGIPTLLYEAGEALRFNEVAIRAGVKGIVSVMRHLDMLASSRRAKRKAEAEAVVARSSTWVRASESGILRTIRPLGARVRKGEVIGLIADPMGDREIEVQASASGIVIGRVNLPLVNEGEGLFHIARFESPRTVEAEVERLQAMDPNDPLHEDEFPLV
jgi:uncharacterized protein